MHIVLATQKAFIQTTPKDWFVEQIIQEDTLLTSALNQLGYDVSVRAWDDTTSWTDADAIIIRAIWNYSDHVAEFKAWLNEVTSTGILINPLSTVLDNMDKRYLSKLNNKGIAIPNTQFIEKNDPRPLNEWVEHLGWKDIVIKPTVSAGGRHTYHIQSDDVLEQSALFATLIAQEAMMIQEYQFNITKMGEITLVCFNGKYSHGVRKYAKDGEFRVQDDFGGRVEPYTPTLDEIELAERAMQCISPTPVYGRVDMMWDNQGELCVSELELIEPELWLRYERSSAKTFANAVNKSLSNHKLVKKA